MFIIGKFRYIEFPGISNYFQRKHVHYKQVQLYVGASMPMRVQVE